MNPALRRAAQREGVGPNTDPTASGAAGARLPTSCWGVGWGGRWVTGLESPGGVGGGGAGQHVNVRPNVSASSTGRGRRSKRQRNSEQRSARASE